MLCAGLTVGYVCCVVWWRWVTAQYTPETADEADQWVRAQPRRNGL